MHLKKIICVIVLFVLPLMFAACNKDDDNSIEDVINNENNEMKKIITTEEAPKAIGPYSQAVQIGDIIYCSGQLGLDPKTGMLVGNTVKEQTEQAFKNIAAVLKAAGANMDQVVKTTVYLTDMAAFAEMNEVYATQFSGNYPARSAVSVVELPKKGLVEIEVVADVSLQIH